MLLLLVMMLVLLLLLVVLLLVVLRLVVVVLLLLLVLGPSWGSMRTSGGHVGPSSEAKKARREEGGQHGCSFKFRRLFGFLGGPVQVSKGTRNRLGAVLRPLGCASEAIWSRPGVLWAISDAILRPEALLEPSWAILDSSAPRATPSSRPRGGCRGKGKPSPEQISVIHVRPEGWWHSPPVSIMPWASAAVQLTNGWSQQRSVNWGGCILGREETTVVNWDLSTGAPYTVNWAPARSDSGVEGFSWPSSFCPDGSFCPKCT